VRQCTTMCQNKSTQSTDKCDHVRMTRRSGGGWSRWQPANPTCPYQSQTESTARWDQNSLAEPISVVSAAAYRRVLCKQLQWTTIGSVQHDSHAFNCCLLSANSITQSLIGGCHPPLSVELTIASNRIREL